MNHLSDWPLAENNSENINGHQLTRERNLTFILVGFAIVGALIYGINTIFIIQQNAWILALIYAVVLVWIFVIAFVRQLPYTFRAASMLIILFGLGISSSIQIAITQNSLVWFFALSVFTGIFIGVRSSIISVIICTLTYIILNSIMIYGGILSFFNGLSTPLESSNGWVFSAISYPLLSLMTTFSIGYLTNGFESKIHKNEELIRELSYDRKELKERNSILERRELQVRAATEISRSIFAERDPDIVFQQVVDHIKNRFDLYYVGVFTLDKSGHYAVLRAGTGEPGKNMLARGHQLGIDTTSMIGSAIRKKEPLKASDVDMEKHRYDNPELPLTRSELALPMIASEQILGAITIHSTEPNAFDDEDIVVYQIVADSLANATFNGILLQQVQTSLEESQNLHNQYLSDSWEKATSRDGSFEYTYEQEDDNTPNIPDTPLPPISLNLPLLLRDQPIGKLFIEADRSALSPQEYAFIESVLHQTALALENLRLSEETQYTVQQDQIVNKISEELTHAMDVESVIKTAVRELGRLPNVTEVSVHIEPFVDEN